MALSNYSLVLALCLIGGIVGATHNGQLIILEENDWSRMLEGEWMIEFYAPWCPACRNLEPIWKEFSTWANDLDINIATVDVTTNPGMSGRFLITQLPSIYHVKDGVFRQYRGSRSKDAFISLIEDRKYLTLEPVSRWQAPDTIQMTVVAGFFKIAVIAKNAHNYMVDQLGFPPFASYIVFIAATILIGSLLGLVLVFIMDIFYPQKDIREVPASDKSQLVKQDQVVTEEEEEEEEDTVEEDGVESDKKEQESEGEDKQTPTVRQRVPTTTTTTDTVD